MTSSTPDGAGGATETSETKGGPVPRPPSRWWTFLACAVILGVAGGVGLVLRQPWLFPSLGPTVILLLESPTEKSARMGNTLVGHMVGVAAGLGALAVTGTYGQPSAPVAGLSLGYVLAGALSVTVTMLVLHLARRPHPPAGATTLLVSLGIMTTATQLLSLLGAVLLVTVLAVAATRRERSVAGSVT